MTVRERPGKTAFRFWQEGSGYDRNLMTTEADVPLLHVCGAVDKTVPIEENTYVVERRYKKLGGRIRLIVKPDCGHHPHSLKDPTPIVEFILTEKAKKPDGKDY